MNALVDWARSGGTGGNRNHRGLRVGDRPLGLLRATILVTSVLIALTVLSGIVTTLQLEP
jgi:hypothetical protein